MMMPGPCTDGEGLSTTNMTLSSLSLANTGIPSLATLKLFHCSLCESVSHSLHILANFYEATNYQTLLRNNFLTMVLTMLLSMVLPTYN